MKIIPALAIATATTTAAAFAPGSSAPSSSATAAGRTAPLAVSSLDESADYRRQDAAADAASSTTTTTSEALPFLPTPAHLADLQLAGNFGFDPLGLSKSQDDVLAFREAEIKHSRLAMLAAAGWPVSELLDRPLAETLGLPSTLDAADRVPSVLNGGLESISPVWWGACLGLTAAIDLYGVIRSRAGNPDYFPGHLGFDPLGLYPADKEGQERMQLAEIKHGRVSMLAITGFAFQEFATELGVVDETPFFFYPAFVAGAMP